MPAELKLRWRPIGEEACLADVARKLILEFAEKVLLEEAVCDFAALAEEARLQRMLVILDSRLLLEIGAVLLVLNILFDVRAFESGSRSALLQGLLDEPVLSGFLADSQDDLQNFS